MRPGKLKDLDTVHGVGTLCIVYSIWSIRSRGHRRGRAESKRSLRQKFEKAKTLAKCAAVQPGRFATVEATSSHRTAKKRWTSGRLTAKTKQLDVVSFTYRVTLVFLEQVICFTVMMKLIQKRVKFNDAFDLDLDLGQTALFETMPQALTPKQAIKKHAATINERRS